MAISPYVARLRALVGRDLLMLPSAAGIVYDDEGRVLFVRQRPDGVWSTPGGSLEPEETPAEGAVREVREETGLETAVVRLLGVIGGPSFVVEYPNGDRSQYLSTVFECAVIGGTLRPDHDEVSEVAFLSLDEARAVITQPWLLDALPKIYARSVEAFY
jgi:ADP-ribose pyrophosphatase YjhB (NUDIX family)